MTSSGSSSSSASPPLTDAHNKNLPAELNSSTLELSKQRDDLLLQAAIHLHIYNDPTFESAPINVDLLAKLELLPSKVFDQKSTWTPEIKHYAKTSLTANLLLLKHHSSSSEQLLQQLLFLLTASQQHTPSYAPPNKRSNTESPPITFDTAMQQLPNTTAHRGNVFLLFNIASLLLSAPATTQPQESSSSSPSASATVSRSHTQSISNQLLRSIISWVDAHIFSCNVHNTHATTNTTSPAGQLSKQSPTPPFDSHCDVLIDTYELLSYQLLHVFSTFKLIQLRAAHLFHEADLTQATAIQQDMEALFTSWDLSMQRLMSCPLRGDVFEVFLLVLRLLHYLQQAQYFLSARPTSTSKALIYVEAAHEVFTVQLLPIVKRLSIPDKREAILWLPVQRDTDLHMIRFLGDILYLRRNAIDSIAEVRLPLDDLRVQMSMLKAKVLFNQGKLFDVQALLTQYLQRPQATELELACCRANLAMMLTLAKKPHTGQLHLHKVLDNMRQNHPDLSSYQHPTVVNKLLYNLALSMMGTQHFYEAFQYFQVVIQRSETWNVVQVVRLLLRAAECCVHHHKKQHTSASGKCTLSIASYPSNRRLYHVLRGETGASNQQKAEEDSTGCDLNTARSMLIHSYLMIKCNSLPPSRTQIHILQNLMYIAILQQDPSAALRYGDLLQPLLLPTNSAVYLNLRSKALFDLRRFAEARQSIALHFQHMSSSNSALCRVSEDCFFATTPSPSCDANANPLGVAVTSHNITHTSHPYKNSTQNSHPQQSLAFTSLIFQSNDLLCQLVARESSVPFDPQPMDALLQAYPRFTPLWKLAIYAKLRHHQRPETVLASSAVVGQRELTFREVQAMVKDYNHLVK